MMDGRLFIYAIALLVLSAAAALIVVRMLAARRTAHQSFDEDEERPWSDIPLLFQPRAVPPMPLRSPSAMPQQPSAQPQPAPTPVAAAVPPRPQNGSPLRKGADFTSPPPAQDDGAMQLLPGRLEPLNQSMQQEIRFVKVPGVTRFTFGRSPGPAYEHVQLRAATASRMHGYMAFEGGRWRIGNLSETNRVIVNGAPLMEDSGRLLEDGDRIEFGEVAFVFRER